MKPKTGLDIETICMALNNHFKEKFGICLEKTILCTYDRHEWNDFLNAAGLESNYSGFYSPKMASAHIPEEHPLALQFLYHEYFGHGMHFEHTKEGREMHRLETELWWMKQGLNEMKNKNEYITEISEKAREADELYGQARLDNEAFAVWMQYYLSKLTHKYEMFNESLKLMPVKVINACAELIKLSKAEGPEAVLAKYGMIGNNKSGNKH